MTITEIARLAGVSISTVSKIVNNKDESISAETRERVLKVVREYNYRPYASVMAHQGCSGMIGVILQEHSGAMLQGIISAAGSMNYTPAIRLYEHGNDDVLKALSSLFELNIDGLIIDGSPNEVEAFSAIEKSDIPILYLSEENENTPAIDYAALGTAATEALITRGHTAIACLLGTGARSKGFEQGYRTGLFKHGLTFDEELIFDKLDSRLLAKLAAHAFGGIVVSHFHDALKLYKATSDLRYEVPYDVSIISLKGGEGQSICPPISTIEIPRRQYGAALACELISRIERSNKPDRFITVAKLSGTDSIDVPYAARMPHVVVVGSINVDNYLMFESLPHAGKSTTAPSSVTFPGGKCLNEAIGVARMGHAAAAIGRVGNDADADYLFESLKTSAVDTVGISRTRNYRTGQGYIFVPRDGDSMITVMAGANGAVTADDIDAQTRLFEHATYCLINTEIPFEAVKRSLEIAHEKGVRTVLKPSAIDHLDDSALSLVDLLIPNVDELDTLCPNDDQSFEEKALGMLASGAGSIVVTQGPKGCTVFQPETQPVHIDAINIESIDSTGAGDAFISALVSYLIRGYDLERSARIATYAAGLSTTQQGATAALADQATLEALIRHQEPELLER